MSRNWDAEYCDYVAGRLSSLRRLAAVLCDDWQSADDLLQAALTRLYVHWGRARAAEHPDAYARTVLVHEFVHERRSAWVKRVSLVGRVSDSPAIAVDHDAVLDLCSPGTVKSQTARALEAVRRALGPGGEAGAATPARRAGGGTPSARSDPR